MRYWTIQDIGVLDQIQSNGVYLPDFSKSAYLKSMPNLKELYDYILNSFNNINFCDIQGLVFSFVVPVDVNNTGDARCLEFYKMIKDRKLVIESLWNTLASKNSVLIEIEMEEQFLNPLYIDMNDFQLIMPPVSALPPYTDKDISEIIINISKGICTKSKFPGHLLQAHLPYISANDIAGTYKVLSMPEIEELLSIKF